MNGTHQPQQEQLHIIDRVARLETAIDYQGQAISGLREETRAGFARVDASFARVDAEFVRVDAEFVRVHEQLLKIRTTDFRILLTISLSTALGTLGLLIKVFGVLQTH